MKLWSKPACTVFEFGQSNFSSFLHFNTPLMSSWRCWQQVFSVPPLPLRKTKAMIKALHSILKDNPSLCSQLSKLFTRYSQFPIPNLFNWHILSGSHLLIQFLSASPVPIYTLCENIHPASACQICTFHFTSWELLSSKERSPQGWFWPSILV